MQHPFIRTIRRLGTTRSLATAMLASLLVLGTAAAQDIQYGDFTSTAGLSLNGSAAGTGAVLRLVPDVTGQAGSAYWSTQLATATSFETRFQFQIPGDKPVEQKSDGLAFIIHADPRADTALGVGGEALGYSNLGSSGVAISPSVIIEFDIYRNGPDPDDRHVSLMLDGDKANHVAFASLTDAIDNGELKTVEISYDSGSHELSVFFSEGAEPPSLLFTEIVDIGARVGAEAYFGFSAGTGGGFAAHDLLNWTLSTACSGLTVSGSGLPSTQLDFELSGAPALAPAFLFLAHATGTTDIGFGPLGMLSLGVSPPWLLLPLGLTDADGSAALTIPLPPWPLPFSPLFAQTTTAEFQLSPLGFVFCTSNVVPFSVGEP